MQYNLDGPKRHLFKTTKLTPCKQDSIVANNLGKLFIKVHREGLRHFVEVLRRGETGASGIIGQT